MAEKLEALEQQLRQLEKEKQQNIKESNDLLNYNGMKIVQDENYFNFSLDSVILSVKLLISSSVITGETGRLNTSL